MLDFASSLMSCYKLPACSVEDAMLVSPKNAFTTEWKVVILETKEGNTANFIKNRLINFSSRENQPDFDNIRHCSLDQSNLDSCFGADQYIICAIKKDVTMEVFPLK